MEHLTEGVQAPTHDLIQLRPPIALISDERAPSWVAPALQRIPWVVVRRGYVRNAMLPVGVRGAMRSQRFGAFIAIAQITERLSPEDLAASSHFVEQQRKNEVPALAALDRIAPLLLRRKYRWGPGGSVGFEIATGVAASNTASDLDLILRQDCRLERSEAIELMMTLAELAAPARIDVLLETPLGGVSLADLAAERGQTLIRTSRGPRLSLDPWLTDDMALFEAQA